MRGCEQRLYRLVEYINENKILSEYQFGFQRNKSTELAVSTIVSKISDAYEKHKSSYCIFLDFAKAFDTVNHDILLEKVKYYGFKNKEFLWLKSYLSNRTQRTQIEDILSKQSSCRCFKCKEEGDVNLNRMNKK